MDYFIIEKYLEPANMSLTPFDKAHIDLGIAQSKVIRLYGIGIFKAISPHYTWALLEEKRQTCPTVQAYFKALEAYDGLQEKYMQLHHAGSN